MWSVKGLPKPGLARISRALARRRAAADGRELESAAWSQTGPPVDRRCRLSVERRSPETVSRGPRSRERRAGPRPGHGAVAGARLSRLRRAAMRVADLGGACGGRRRRARRGRRRRRPRPRGGLVEAEVLEQQRRPTGSPRSGRPCPGRRCRAPSRAPARTCSGAVPVRVDVAARGQPDAAGDGGGEVGEDVAEQVVGDDHVEARRGR